MHRCYQGAAAALTVVAGIALAPAPAEAATYTAPLRTAVSALPTATEVRAGYRRTLFPIWKDADHDGCNTRNEVLIAEAKTKPTVSAGCHLTGGRWYSYYDRTYWTLATDLDIDHVVPLAEAWDSGARRWTTAKRQAYANDLGDKRSLVAVTDNVNQAKGDQDPGTWMPPAASARCRYLGEFVAVKLRWRLTVNPAEKRAMTRYAAACPNATITVTRA